MPVGFVKKFRSVGLDEADEPEVRQAILETRDGGKLLSYLYIYGYSFNENKEVLKICDYYLGHHVPGLTAVCMRVTIDYWNMVEEYYDILEKFLNADLFEEWYDEIIFAVSFVNRRINIDFPAQILDKFNEAIKNPEINSLEIFGPSLYETRVSGKK